MEQNPFYKSPSKLSDSPEKPVGTREKVMKKSWKFLKLLKILVLEKQQNSLEYQEQTSKDGWSKKKILNSLTTHRKKFKLIRKKSNFSLDKLSLSNNFKSVNLDKLSRTYFHQHFFAFWWPNVVRDLGSFFLN